MKAKKVLIITYYWPPSGGAGVQRWLKFAKYLPEFGWAPIILAPDPKFATYPVYDESLMKDIEKDAEVYRTKSREIFSTYQKITNKKQVPYGGFASEGKSGFIQKASRFIRGNFFLPDPRKGWNKFALRKASELIRENNIDIVITTSPPHSTHLIGLALKKKFGIKWIADFRDPWTKIYYNNLLYQTSLAKAIDRKYEQKVLQGADSIITVSKQFKSQFAGTDREISDKTKIIYNGFDPMDFNVSCQKEKHLISYIGTLSDIYPVEKLAHAIKQLIEEYPSINIRFVGKVSEFSRKLIESYIPDQHLSFVNNVPHDQAVQQMQKSDILLLVMPMGIGNEGIIPGKIFEYLASGSKILCIGSVDGDAGKIIQETGHGLVAGYDDEKLIRNHILALLAENYNEGAFQNTNNIEKYSRKSLTRELGHLLNETVKK